MKLNESQQILKNILNESTVPYGFEDYKPDDFFYSVANAHAYNSLKGLKEYFDEFYKEVEADGFKFQGVEDKQALQQVSAKIDEAIKLCDKTWNMEE